VSKDGATKFKIESVKSVNNRDDRLCKHGQQNVTE
jgi:hypothetical protein